jgi:hypothetical protein
MTAPTCSKCNDTGSLSRDVYDGTLDCTHCEVATERMALLDWFHQNIAHVTQSEVWLIYQRGKAASSPAWQPIETAPKDVPIFVFNGEYGVMQWSEGVNGTESWALWVWSDDLINDADPSPDQPTHWMPLPAAPVGENHG